MTRHNSTAGDSTETTTTRDPTQLVPPWVDTGMRMRIPFRGKVPAREIAAAAPGLTVAIAGVYLALLGGGLGFSGALVEAGAVEKIPGEHAADPDTFHPR